MDGSTFRDYGVVTLAHHSLRNVSFELNYLRSRMDRHFLLCGFDHEGTHVRMCALAFVFSSYSFRQLAVGNVHLESLNNRSCRRDQMIAISECLAPHSNAMFMGDFNFDDRCDANAGRGART